MTKWGVTLERKGVRVKLKQRCTLPLFRELLFSTKYAWQQDPLPSLADTGRLITGNSIKLVQRLGSASVSILHPPICPPSTITQFPLNCRYDIVSCLLDLQSTAHKIQSDGVLSIFTLVSICFDILIRLMVLYSTAPFHIIPTK